METELVAAKWFVPRTRANGVARPRLARALDGALAAPITIVSAPAGFGKTTLVAAWCAERARSCAWLSLDAQDNDPALFFQYLIASLQTLEPALGAAAAALVASAPQVALVSLLNDLNCDVSEAVLVLDDYHVLENPHVHEAVAYLVEHAPPTFHLILTTRADPPLPLARWRARARLLELRAADLRFTGGEAAQFLNAAMGLDLSPEQIAQLETRTEGWAAGLQLAALALQAHDANAGRAGTARFIESFAGSHRYVIGYLAQEVLDGQSARAQNFLLRTSILDRMCGALCDTVTGAEGGAATLALLEGQNLFVVPLDGEGIWYRYHHLFAEVLRNRLRQEAGEDVPALHRRASGWFEENNFYPEAIQHAFAAKDPERAAQLVEHSALPLLVSGGGQIATVTNWLNTLPPALKHARPRLLLIEAWSLVGRAPAEAIEAPLRQAEELFRKDPATDTRALRGEAAALRTVLYGFLYEDARALDYAAQALELLPEDAFYVRALVRHALGYVQLVTGDLDAVEQTLIPALETARGDPTLLLAEITMLATLGLARGEGGDLRGAVRLHEEARELVEREGRPLPLQSSMLVYVDLATYHYERDELDAAERYYDLARELNQATRDPRLEAHVLMGKALLASARGDPKQAERRMDEAARLRPQISAAISRATLDELRVFFWVQAGDLDAAADWLMAHPPGETASPASVQTLLYQFSRARLATARRKWDDAGELLRQIERAARDAGHGLRVMHAQILQAVLLHAQNRTASALDAFENALTLAAEEGYVRSFVDEGAPVRELAQEYVKRGRINRLRDYGEQLVAAFTADLTPGSAQAEVLIEPLSEREREVLGWIARGASNREIAEALTISPNTVKKHTINVFGKLGVNSRTQALARARELGVL